MTHRKSESDSQLREVNKPMALYRGQWKWFSRGVYSVEHIAINKQVAVVHMEFLIAISLRFQRQLLYRAPCRSVCKVF
jgi:hypothetical protein